MNRTLHRSLTRQYDSLTHEERFRLILAAGARGDEAEQQRLVRAGERLHLTMPGHSPWAHAFNELSFMVLLELLEEASRHRDAFECWSDAEDDGRGKKRRTASTLKTRAFDLYLAQGFILKTKHDGWKLFCERLSLPPSSLWQPLPGYDRLCLALDMFEERAYRPAAAFTPEGMAGWMARTRPADSTEPTSLISPRSFADDLNECYRERVAWWGG